MPREGYEIIRTAEGKVLKFNFENSIYNPSIEDDPFVMAQTIGALAESGQVEEIIFSQNEEYVYEKSQANLLYEIAEVNQKLIAEERVLDFSGFGEDCRRFFPEWFNFLQSAVLQGIKQDPVGSYVRILRRHREEVNSVITEHVSCAKQFSVVLEKVLVILGQTKLLKIAAPHLDGYKSGDRTFYKQIFKPSIRPNFMYTKLVTSYPAGAEEIDNYKIADDTQVLILKTKTDIRPIYHLTPPEFRLTEDKYALLTDARAVLAEHRPERKEFTNIERTRETFINIEKDLIRDLAKNRNIKLEPAEVEELAKILIRYTIGFGMIELILSDENIQDIVVNAPVGINPISVIHSQYGECTTNATPLNKEAESWATKLRLMSGRPLDQANPVLDTELYVPHGRARVSAMQPPLSPKGYSFAFRRHRDRTWTLPLFIQNGMITSLAAGLISFLMDGARTVLIAGSRSSGKTSMLDALLLEIARSSRVVTIEDTLELNVAGLRKLGYDVQSMKVRSAIAGGKSEVPAEDAIRTALRLGDSALIIGEVRSTEAKALYEAMRVGALAKVVAGTIHGDSPYGVYDRVVNDLGVPKTSFKATDVILVTNPITTPSGLEHVKRVVQITEVGKTWTNDPLAEKGFKDLLTYNAKTDMLEPTAALKEGESEVIKAIGSRVKEWSGNWDGIWENIEVRAKIKQKLVDYANETKNSEILEAPFVIKSNEAFHRISDIVAKDVGTTDAKRVYAEWEHWFKQQFKEDIED